MIPPNAPGHEPIYVAHKQTLPCQPPRPAHSFNRSKQATYIRMTSPITEDIPTTPAHLIILYSIGSMSEEDRRGNRMQGMSEQGIKGRGPVPPSVIVYDKVSLRFT